MRNCLTYAVSQYAKNGGYLVMRKSQFAKAIGAGRWHIAHMVPHFLHMDRDKRITQYVPTDEQKQGMLKKGAFKQWLALWHFDGCVVEGD